MSIVLLVASTDEHFREMIRAIGGLGIAIENNCAIEFIDGKVYRVITSRSYSGAYRVYRSGGEVFAEKIRQVEQMTPIHKLMDVRRK